MTPKQALYDWEVLTITLYHSFKLEMNVLQTQRDQLNVILHAQLSEEKGTGAKYTQDGTSIVTVSSYRGIHWTITAWLFMPLALIDSYVVMSLGWPCVRPPDPCECDVYETLGGNCFRFVRSYSMMNLQVVKGQGHSAPDPVLAVCISYCDIWTMLYRILFSNLPQLSTWSWWTVYILVARGQRWSSLWILWTDVCELQCHWLDVSYYCIAVIVVFIFVCTFSGDPAWLLLLNSTGEESK